ncbi:MAG: phosphatase PAP2 family protein [Bacteroidia bacterium]
MMRYLSFFLLICSLNTSVLAQQNTDSPYQYNRKRDIGLSLGIGALSLTAHYLQRQLTPLTDLQLSQLDPNSVNAFDRPTIGNWNPRAATISDVLLGASLLAPYALPLLKKEFREERLDLWLMGFQTMVYADFATTWTKYSVRRVRPFAYLPSGNDASLFMKQREPDARYSFFSGHTSGAAVASFYAASIYQVYFPESRSRYIVWGAAILLPAIVGYYRVRAGKHYPSDVMAGYLVGASIGILNPWFHRKR